MTNTCPVRSRTATLSDRDSSGRDAVLIDCPHCGNYALSGSLYAAMPDVLTTVAEAGPRFSHALRRAQEGSARPLFTTNTVEAPVKQPLPRPREQADLLVRWLAEHTFEPGETVWIGHEATGAIVGSKSPAGLELVVDPDPNCPGIEIQVASDRFAGRTRIFAGLNELNESARHIEACPATPEDHREYQFGIRKPGKASGHCAVRLQCIDPAGHARLEVTIDDDGQFHEPATAAFGFPVFAADLDCFTDQLRDVQNAKRGSAHLPQAVEPRLAADGRWWCTQKRLFKRRRWEDKIRKVQE